MRLFTTLCAFFLATNLAHSDPLFPNSVVSNDLDFITTEDPSAFYCLKYFGRDRQEMPDKRNDQLFVDRVHTFEAWFEDGSTVGIWVHPKLGSTAKAERMARKIVDPLGRLPSFMRESLNHVVVHAGDHTAFAEDRGQFFVLYDRNISKRIATHDLEETVFHEAVHATMDIPFGSRSAWKTAQRKDGGFVTDYAAQLPDKEDLAETALFAFAYYRHPNRLPSEVRAKLEQLIPHRLAALKAVFGPSQTLQRKATSLAPCD